MDMTILSLDIFRIKEFIDFNQRIYPERKDVEKHFQWQILDNPILENKKKPYVLLYYEKGKIVGQFLLNPFEWHFLERTYRGYFGINYYVLNEQRGVGGALLAMKAIRGYTPYFTIGPSEVSKKIHLSLKTRIVGNIHRFVWFRNFFVLLLIAVNIVFKNRLQLICRKDKEIRCPSLLSLNRFEFRLVTKLGDLKEYYWSKTLEFSRSPEFLRWRFFNDFKKYYFYLADNPGKYIYFVIRKYNWRGLIFLAIVDYKVPKGDFSSWRAILKASKILAKKNNCDGVITVSSHQFFDSELKRTGFIKIGRENPILTNAEMDILDKVIQDRNFVYVTMADGDIDLWPL